MQWDDLYSKIVTAQENSFATRVLGVGYKTLTEAIQDAKVINDLKNELDTKSGPLVASQFYDKFRQQLAQGDRVIVALPDVPGKTRAEKYQSLGQLRAIARKAALALGCDLPTLEDSNWERLPQSNDEYDTWGLRYYADVVPRKELFWKLAIADKKELLDLAKRH